MRDSPVNVAVMNTKDRFCYRERENIKAIPATKAYLNRYVTTPVISTGVLKSLNYCVLADAIDASEIGAILLTKIHPEAIAPARIIGLLPNETPERVKKKT